ncbi:MAG: hypothetical protein ACR2MB_12335 [Acidimicrobiales bacterium]
MTTNNPTPTPTGARRPAGLRTFTEAKAGQKTTEFLMTVVFVIAVLIAAYLNNSDAISRSDGWRYAVIAVAAYSVSRGLAKLGTREPYTDDGYGNDR